MRWAAATLKGDAISFRYRRVYRSKCSLFGAGARCWRTIAQDTGLKVPMPDCRASYVAEQKRVPKFAKETADDPTVVEYDAVLTVDGRGNTIVPVAGTKVSCRPAE
jgi:hypothetical protein